MVWVGFQEIKSRKIRGLFIRFEYYRLNPWGNESTGVVYCRKAEDFNKLLEHWNCLGYTYTSSDPGRVMSLEEIRQDQRARLKVNLFDANVGVEYIQ